MSEDNLQKQIDIYQEVARENPGVDVNVLMQNALDVESKKFGTGKKSYKWAYTVALGLPPFGLVYTVKYYINGDDEDKRAGKICALLTVVSVLLIIAMGKLFFSSAGITTQQLQQINPSQVQQLQQLYQGN